MLQRKKCQTVTPIRGRWPHIGRIASFRTPDSLCPQQFLCLLKGCSAMLLPIYVNYRVQNKYFYVKYRIL